MKFLNMLTLFLLTLSTVYGGEMIAVGKKAPDFNLKDAAGKTHHLSDYAGKLVVLYFYPKDNTPGCTAEACNLRDNFSALTERGVVVLGVSFDDQESHQAFRDKYELPFPILSDTDKKVSEAYGTTRAALIGFIGAKRITYLIDGNQIVRHVFDSVDTKNHSQQILEVINEQNLKAELPAAKKE